MAGKSFVPVVIKRLIRQFTGLIERKRYKMTLSRTIFNPPAGEIAVNYGGALSRGREAIIHGGATKLIYLDKAYPEKNASFNILYFVSSALPEYAVELVDWAKSQGAVFVMNQNGVGYRAWAGPEYKHINKIMKLLIGKADYVIYQSQFCKKSADLFLGAVNTSHSIVYNYVDTDMFTPPADLIPETPWILLVAGSHATSDRVHVALETLSVLVNRNHDARLIVAGRLEWPDAHQDLQNAINKLNLRSEVILEPPYTQKQAPGLFRRAHLLIHPKYKDPCPTVVIESMACGVPVVGSNSGGVTEMVGEDAGILLDVPESWDQSYYPDANKMADRVETIMGNHNYWSKRARARAVEKYGKELWLKKHADIFSMLVNSE